MSMSREFNLLMEGIQFLSTSSKDSRRLALQVMIYVAYFMNKNPPKYIMVYGIPPLVHLTKINQSIPQETRIKESFLHAIHDEKKDVLILKRDNVFLVTVLFIWKINGMYLCSDFCLQPFKNVVIKEEKTRFIITIKGETPHTTTLNIMYTNNRTPVIAPISTYDMEPKDSQITLISKFIDPSIRNLPLTSWLGIDKGETRIYPLRLRTEKYSSDFNFVETLDGFNIYAKAVRKA